MSVASSRIDSKAEHSPLVRGALSVARQAHAGQVRQTGCEEVPFIEHLLAVGELLAEYGYGDEVLAAGLLHDVIEHTELRSDPLHDRFGPEVAGLVEALSEDEEIPDYEERKEEHRDRVGEAGEGARAIFAADKTANVIALREAYAVRGELVDEELPVGLDVKILVWEFDLEMLFRHTPEAPLVERFADEMVGLWGQRAEGGRASVC
ncbi:MAG TPA: HD domain-containing protein [Solirubrobacterales bacterium]|nr:HD domain-containing protein [Solirubrobacterales bacterium]